MSDTHKARCYFPHSDSTLGSIEVHAHSLNEENRDIAGIKLANGDKKMQKRFKEVTETARLTEFNPNNHWKISAHISPELSADQPHWELAAVIADRTVRGLLASVPERLIALGQSAHWETGKISPLEDIAHSQSLKNLKRQLQKNDTVYLAENPQPFSQIESQALEQHTADINYITHLGGLTGQPDPNRAVRSTQVYFPLINGNAEHDCLARVTVTVVPIRKEKTTEDNPSIRCLGQLSRSQQRMVKETLEQSRAWDKQSNQHWQTVVRFSRDDFQDQSYQLALVMADRIARGREVPPQNRLIATGCSTRWANGEVHHVEQQSSKLQLLFKTAHPHDRILLPSTWQVAVDASSGWAEKKLSIACIDRLQY